MSGMPISIFFLLHPVVSLRSDSTNEVAHSNKVEWEGLEASAALGLPLALL
jgi:hypothetical protein